MTLAWGAFSAVEECSRIFLSLLQLLPICYICKISIALFLHVGLIMTCCHATLCFTVSRMLRCWAVTEPEGTKGSWDSWVPLSMLGAYNPQDSLGDNRSLSPNTSLSSFIKTMVKTAWKANQPKVRPKSGRENIEQIMANWLHPKSNDA